MSLDNDNIFEKMRIILPEHKRTTMQFQRELAAIKHNRPEISSDQYIEFSAIIAEAALDQTKIKVTLWNKYEDKTIVGIPLIDRGLQIQTDDGIVTLDTKLVIGVTSINS